VGKRILVVLDHVRCGLDVPMLQPGSPEGAMLLGCTARIGIDTVTSVLDAPRMGKQELLRLLARRIGRVRVERERTAAGDLVSWCCGHPLAVAVIASLVRTRPHWSLGRLLHRLAHEPAPQSLAAGGFDLVASVRTRTELLDADERAWLGEFARAKPGPHPVPVSYGRGSWMAAWYRRSCPSPTHRPPFKPLSEMHRERERVGDTLLARLETRGGATEITNDSRYIRRRSGPGRTNSRTCSATGSTTRTIG
jgi:hypothetical protein